MFCSAHREAEVPLVEEPSVASKAEFFTRFSMVPVPLVMTRLRPKLNSPPSELICELAPEASCK